MHCSHIYASLYLWILENVLLELYCNFLRHDKKIIFVVHACVRFMWKGWVAWHVCRCYHPSLRFFVIPHFFFNGCELCVIYNSDHYMFTLHNKVIRYTMGPLLWTEISINFMAWINNNIHKKSWDVIFYPWRNFNNVLINSFPSGQNGCHFGRW